MNILNFGFLQDGLDFSAEGQIELIHLGEMRSDITLPPLPLLLLEFSLYITNTLDMDIIRSNSWQITNRGKRNKLPAW